MRGSEELKIKDVLGNRKRRKLDVSFFLWRDLIEYGRRLSIFFFPTKKMIITKRRSERSLSVVLCRLQVVILSSPHVVIPVSSFVRFANRVLGRPLRDSNNI